MLLHELLDRSVERFSQREAVRHRRRSLSYAQLQMRSCAAAQGLRSLGVRRGDRVCLFLQNRPEMIEAAIACSRLGAIFVPANPMLRERQLVHILKDSGARALLTFTTSVVSMDELANQCPELQWVIECDSDPLRNSRSPRLSWKSYEELTQSAEFDREERCAIEKDAAAILYTSGSTGKAKGVVVSHRNLTDGARIVSGYLCNTQEDRLLAALPFSFDYGFSQATTALNVGACVVLTNYSLPAELLREIAEHRITGLAGVPTMWSHLAASDWSAVAHDLRYITNSGGVLTNAVLRRLQQHLPRTKVFCMYGLTEAFRSTYLDPEELNRRPGSIGKAIPGQEILVLDESGAPRAAGQPGELVHRGSLVTLGYWNDPEQTSIRYRPLGAGLTQLPLPEFAVWSGDLVTTDEDGFLYFVGRKDQLIKTSGHRISAGEIEEVVAEVDGVVENALVGLADEVLGHRLVAALVCAAGEREDTVEAVRRHCRRQLPAYMTPADICVLESIPRNVNGKPDRAALENILRDRLKR